MDFHPIDIVLHIINIAVLYALLRMWVFKPVRQFMAGRQNRVTAQIEDAQTKQSEANHLKDELTVKLATVHETCEGLMAESRQKGSDAAQKIIDQAEDKARIILLETRQVAQAQRQQIMDSAKVDLADLAIDMATRVLKFDQAILSQVVEPKAKQGTLQGTLKTATHCDENTIATMKTMLENLVGANLQLDVQEDEGLLGGFAAYIDGQVYDFSYAAQLATMKQALK